MYIDLFMHSIITHEQIGGACKKEKMTDMIVLAFGTEDGAEKAREKVIEVGNQYMFGLHQIVEVVRKPDGQVKIMDEPKLTGIAALGGAFWGLLVGIIFFIPVVGVAIGAATGAIVGHFEKYGFSKAFMKQIEEAVQPGNSALFILADDLKVDRLTPALADLEPKVLRTTLSADQEEKLRQAFGNAKPSPVAMTATA